MEMLSSHSFLLQLFENKDKMVYDIEDYVKKENEKLKILLPECRSRTLESKFNNLDLDHNMEILKKFLCKYPLIYYINIMYNIDIFENFLEFKSRNDGNKYIYEKNNCTIELSNEHNISIQYMDKNFKYDIVHDYNYSLEKIIYFKIDEEIIYKFEVSVFANINNLNKVYDFLTNIEYKIKYYSDRIFQININSMDKFELIKINIDNNNHIIDIYSDIQYLFAENCNLFIDIFKNYLDNYDEKMSIKILNKIKKVFDKNNFHQCKLYMSQNNKHNLKLTIYNVDEIHIFKFLKDEKKIIYDKKNFKNYFMREFYYYDNNEIKKCSKKFTAFNN